MNYLSWLIYLANITGNLSGFAIFITVVLGLGCAAAIVVALIHLQTTDSRGYELSKETIAASTVVAKTSRRYAWMFFFGMTFAGTFAAIMPSRQTVLLIAASQIGEQVVNHQRVQTVLDPSIELLQTWIAQQTASIRREMAAQGR